uniref:Acyl-CoA-binding domain-containing protein 6 n=1 Tax=Clastoptera arizonana TaxID=38151 RepID=A0A1B6CSJ6_9HEMI
MAEANFMESELKERFLNASAFIKSKVGDLNSSQLLEFYAHYKQATVGDCAISRPRWFDIEGKQKWDAWNNLKSMSKDEAMQIYINLVFDIDSNWENSENESSGNNWISVSSMVSTDDNLQDSEKSIFDWVKEGNKIKVKQFASSVDINGTDCNGLAAIHWAADRGNLEMLKFLTSDLKGDIEVKDEDGQTPLHYAVSCGHVDIVEFLINKGANVKAKDNEGNTPLDLAVDDKVANLVK